MVESSAGHFLSPVDVLTMPDEENDKRVVLQITDDAVVAHAEAILADVQTDERFRELQRIWLSTVPVEFLKDASPCVPRKLPQRTKGMGRENVPHTVRS